MLNSFVGKIRSSPAMLFSVGWFVILLSLLIGIGAPWNTFMLTWKVELVTSIFLIGVLIYFLRHNDGERLRLSAMEVRLIVIPLALFIAWSGISMLYAESWKSALHHTLVWIAYLVFYLAVRRLLDIGGSYNVLLSTVVTALVIILIPTLSAYIGLMIFGGDNLLGIKFARYGEQIATILPLTLVGVVRLKGRPFVVGVASVVALWLIVYCSVGRISNFLFIGIIAISLLSVFLFKRLREYRWRMSLVTACLVVAPVLLQTISIAADKTDASLFARISDAQTTDSNGFRKLMITLSGEMIRDNPLIGVGADNFGFSVNKYRAAYGAVSHDDPNLAIAEGEIPERAHNEYLQIVAELGVIGGAIFVWFLAGIAFMAYRLVTRRPRSPFAYAAVLGLAAFLVSSLVSSFSFRNMQHGTVFFFVLAVAARLLLRHRHADAAAREVSFSPMLVRASCLAGILACMALISYSAIRAASIAMTYRAAAAPDLESARAHYETAMWLDNENPEARSSFAQRLMSEKLYAEAVPLFSESVQIGKGPSFELSYLATAQRLSGDLKAAENTFAAAADLYPRSTFVLTRYAALLRENGSPDKASQVLARAMAINPKTTNTWWAFINDGSRAASEKAFASKEDYVHVMDLWPEASIYALKAERDILYPDERVRYDFGNRNR